MAATGHAAADEPARGRAREQSLERAAVRRVGCRIRTDRRGRLSETTLGSPNRDDRQKRRRVLARQWLRPHLLPQDPLGEDWHLTRGEDARLCRRHGQPLSQPRRILDGAGNVEAEEPGGELY